MDNTFNNTNANKTRNNGSRRLEEEGDSEVWSSLNDGYKEVQSVLDRNRVLIQQVNENHLSRIPDNMVKNVALIQELNGNISKVVSLYSDLSANLTTAFHQRNNNVGGERGSREA